MSALEIQSTKLSIIELLLKSKNENLITQIREALELDASDKDFYYDLTETDKKRIEESKQQIAEGKIHSHESVMMEFGKKYRK